MWNKKEYFKITLDVTGKLSSDLEFNINSEIPTIINYRRKHNGKFETKKLKGNFTANQTYNFVFMFMKNYEKDFKNKQSWIKNLFKKIDYIKYIHAIAETFWECNNSDVLNKWYIIQKDCFENDDMSYFGKTWNHLSKKQQKVAYKKGMKLLKEYKMEINKKYLV
jgi:hypothetical protein